MRLALVASTSVDQTGASETVDRSLRSLTKAENPALSQIDTVVDTNKNVALMAF